MPKVESKKDAMSVALKRFCMDPNNPVTVIRGICEALKIGKVLGGVFLNFTITLIALIGLLGINIAMKTFFIIFKQGDILAVSIHGGGI